MPIIRKKLFADEVYPSDIRYNPDTGTVQSLVNGDWVDNPLADPRNQTTFPPRATADPACDGAKSVSDALKNQISGVITAIDDGKTAFTIIGLILGLFSFGLFDIFVAIALAIANAMLDAGTAALNAALTDAVYDTLTCILFCHMDNHGRLLPNGLNLVKTDVTDQIGGLGATILNSMLSLAGEGGVNNLASKGTSTGDCSGCDCGWCYEFDFTTSSYGLTLIYGTWVDGVGIVGTAAGTGVAIFFNIPLPSSAMMTKGCMTVDCTGTNNISWAANNGAVALLSTTNNPAGSYEAVNVPITLNAGENMGINPSSGAGQGGNVTLTKLRLSGSGDNPFGTNNCEGASDCT